MQRLKEESLNQAIPGVELLKILGMHSLPQLPSEVEAPELFTAEIGDVQLFILRIYVRPQKDLSRPALGLWTVRNEMMPPSQGTSADIRMDFLFSHKAHLLGILPVPGPARSRRDAVARSGLSERTKTPEILRPFPETEMRYFDLSELWVDINQIQPGGRCALDSYNESARRRSLYSAVIDGYLHASLGTNAGTTAPCGRTSYVYESDAHGGPYMRQMSFSDLGFLLSQKDSRLSARGKVYVALPTTYVPGKSVDIGFYDAIGGRELGLEQEDVVFVIGFGSGLDLIFAARKASFAYGLEVNPFSVASGRTNLAVAALNDRASLDWGDVRDLAEGSRSVPEHLLGRVTKVVWNMAYESASKRSTDPLLVSDFRDGYAVLDWFAPFLAHARILAPRWRALLWNIVSDKREFERRFEDFGLQAEACLESSTCIVSPARGS